MVKTSFFVNLLLFGKRKGFDESSEIACVHFYDSQGNHLGLNELGELDNEIEEGLYSPLIDPEQSIYGVESSVLYGEDDYTMVIEGLETGFINFECTYYHKKDIGYISILF